MNIEKSQVKHVAALARLKIEECDMEKWSRDMDAIIGFADSLNELCLKETNAAPSSRTDIFNVFREDELGNSYPNDEILANAPEKYDGCYVVPKIVE